MTQALAWVAPSLSVLEGRNNFVLSTLLIEEDPVTAVLPPVPCPLNFSSFAWMPHLDIDFRGSSLTFSYNISFFR